MAVVFANNTTAVIASGGTTAPASGSTETWTVSSSGFPQSLAAGQWFHVADVVSFSEKILVTAISGTGPYTWTVTRGDEGTVPAAHQPGFTVEQVVTAGDWAGLDGIAVPVAAPAGVTATDTANITAAITKLGTALAAGPATLAFQDGTYVIDASAFVIRSLSNFAVKGSGATVIQLAANRAGQYNTNGDLAVIADCTDFSVSGIRFDWNRDSIAPITPLTASAASGQPSVTVAAGNGARYLAGQRLQVYGGLGSAEQSRNDTLSGSGLTILSITAGGGTGGGDLITFTTNLVNSYTVISSSLFSDGFGPYACAGAYLTPYQTGGGFNAAGRSLANEDTQNALHLMSCQRFLVAGGEFRGTWESPLKLGTGFASTTPADGCSEGIITGNRIQHGYDQGVSVWNSSYITVSANKCQAAGWAGISFTHSNDCTATGNICTGNIYSPASDPGVGSGIAAEGGIRVSVSDNVCSANNYAGILLIQSPLYLANTTLSAPAAAGASSITVGSNAGFQAGSSHTIYDSVNRNIRETIYVASVSGATITLSQNLINAYTSGSPVVARFGEDMRISGNVCADNTLGPGIKAQRQSGLCLFSNDCSGNGLQVETNASSGIYIDTLSDGATVQANTCLNNSDDGIYLGSLQQAVVIGNTVTHSGAPATVKSGIKATGSLDSLFQGNKCSFNSNNGISLETDGTTLPARVQVIDNQAYNNTQRGIIAGDGGSSLTVTGNKTLYNTQQGLNLKGITAAIVTGNQSADNGQDGLLLENNIGGTPCTNILVKGNMLYDDQGTHTQTWGFRDATTSGGGVFVQDNIIYGNTNGAMSLGASDVIPGPAAYDVAVAADSPLIWWKLADASGSSTAADSSGNGHTGTVTAVTLAQPGALTYNATETSGLFNGTSSNVSASYLVGLQAAVSVEAWVNCNGTSNELGARILANSHTDSDNKGFQLRLSGLTLKADFGNGTTFATATAGSLPATGWTHVVATFDSTTIRLYVNGGLAATASLSGSMAAGAASGLSLGYNLTYTGDYFAGYLTQGAVYATALSAARVLTHYMSGAF